MALTALKLLKLAPKDKLYRAADEAGLCIEVHPSGAKYWRYRYRHGGKAKMISLGVFPDVSLADARAARVVAAAVLREGKDPSTERQRAEVDRRLSGANTFEVLAREWLAKRADHWSLSYAERVTGTMERDIFPSLGTRAIADIKPRDLLACLQRIELRGAHESAHRALTDCGQVFRYAVASGVLDSDPTRDLRGALKQVQHRHFSAITDAKGAGELMKAILGYQGTPEVKAALLLSALLFQRPGEVRHMNWADVDLAAAEWRYLVTKTKSNHLVPLPRQAVEALRKIEPLTNRPIAEKPDAPRYVFAGARSRMRPMSENTVRQALRTLGYTNEQMTPHGFRAMARSLLAEMGWKTDAIERQLAHKAAGPLSAAYDRAQFLQERKAMMQAWADYLDRLAAGDAKVVPIRAAA